ncbi:hypothetical protein THIOM_004803 [Candidatus Thiomargarita nelsonii]|uniref:Uncharacterized protein n=1 Tax=Candidatus Thiomargarita nelsonii TaxID=1003181 RepID=A0A176RV05_9GAMM|nr:hypothetical protein THIOM_004803 [Candidatus Thiomargarita nelsonii]
MSIILLFNLFTSLCKAIIYRFRRFSFPTQGIAIKFFPISPNIIPRFLAFFHLTDGGFYGILL